MTGDCPGVGDVGVSAQPARPNATTSAPETTNTRFIQNPPHTDRHTKRVRTPRKKLKLSVATRLCARDMRSQQGLNLPWVPEKSPLEQTDDIVLLTIVDLT